MTRSIALMVGIVFVASVAVTGQTANSPPKPAETQPATAPGQDVMPPTTQPADGEYPTAPGTHWVELMTTEGTIVLELYGDAAPITVGNFLRYAEDDFYQGTIFHRVVPTGVVIIQGGGYTPELEEKEEGLHPPIPNEAGNGLSNVRGTISMARKPDPHSATSQFFINVADNPLLDRGAELYFDEPKGVPPTLEVVPEGVRFPPDLAAKLNWDPDARRLTWKSDEPMTQAQREKLKAVSSGRMYQRAIDYFYLMSWGYTVFGKVIDGMDVVDAIHKTERRRHPRYARGQREVVPVEPIVILDVRRLAEKPAGSEPKPPATDESSAVEGGDTPKRD